MVEYLRRWQVSGEKFDGDTIKIDKYKKLWTAVGGSPQTAADVLFPEFVPAQKPDVELLSTTLSSALDSATEDFRWMIDEANTAFLRAPPTDHPFRGIVGSKGQSIATFRKYGYSSHHARVLKRYISFLNLIRHWSTLKADEFDIEKEIISLKRLGAVFLFTEQWTSATLLTFAAADHVNLSTEKMENAQQLLRANRIDTIRTPDYKKLTHHFGKVLENASSDFEISKELRLVAAAIPDAPHVQLVHLKAFRDALDTWTAKTGRSYFDALPKIEREYLELYFALFDEWTKRHPEKRQGTVHRLSLKLDRKPDTIRRELKQMESEGFKVRDSSNHYFVEGKSLKEIIRRMKHKRRRRTSK